MCIYLLSRASFAENVSDVGASNVFSLIAGLAGSVNVGGSFGPLVTRTSNFTVPSD